MPNSSALEESIRRDGGVSRRAFLACGATVSAWPWFSERLVVAASRRVTFTADPFSLGVASGDPGSTGVVLWTRLAPRPLEPGGGLTPEAIEVQWEIALDEGMKDVVRRGTTLATPQLGHSVHVEAEGLAPDHWYWYRFRAGDAASPVGRTRTLPVASAEPERLRFAFASCQNYEQGLFTAYEHMVKDELDLIFHLGDYIYEYAGKEKGVRKHIGDEITSLDDYRIRYAQYRADPLLQSAHAHCPWMVTWDDHELDNNYAGDVSEEKDVDPLALLNRRVNAYQAYYEMMPLRRRSLPRGPHMRIYRKASYGRLAELLILDTRQYRTDQPNNDRDSDLNAAALDPRNTLLGAEQKGWLARSLIASNGNWNVLAQQVMMGMVDDVPGEARRYSMDQWPGCAHERMQLVRFLGERRVPNPVVLTGDIHSNYVNDLRVDDRKAETPVLATELVGTSISSGGNGPPTPKNLDSLLAENPCIRFHNTQRGYVRCDVSPQEWRSDFIVVEDVRHPGAPAIKRASFVIESGKPGAHPA